MSKINDEIKKLEDEIVVLKDQLLKASCNPGKEWERGLPHPVYQGFTKGACANIWNSITDKDNQIIALEKKKRNTAILITASVAALLVATYYILKAANVIK